MKICIPIEQNNGMDSLTYGHFGSAPYFLIYDSHTMTHEILNNAHAEHEHGMCNPITPLLEKGVTAVIVSGMGAKALMNLQAMDIQVFKLAESTSIKNIVSRLDFSQMEQLNSENCCSHHNCH